MNSNLGIIGCGNMGTAIISGIIKKRCFRSCEIFVYDKIQEKMKRLKKKFSIHITQNSKQLIKNSKIIILAVKPQDMKNLLLEIKDSVIKNLIITIAAGLKINFFEKILGKIPIIRVMPNTPAVLNEGISVIAKNEFVKKNDLKIAKNIFSSIGEVLFVDEKYLNAVTAISGSGPAYLFYLSEIMQEAGVSLNIPEDLVRTLVNQTIFGSAKMLKELKSSPQQLRKNVTSPGGTTEAAFNYLESKNFKTIFVQAIKKAFLRAKELSKMYGGIS